MDAPFWFGFLTIVLSDLLLSGDNAVIIGMAARKLPPAERKKAIFIGTILAVIMRATLTGMATWLLNIPFLKTIGGILLLWIAMKLITENSSQDTHVEAGKDLRSAIKTIVIADVVMSLDNVMAVAGAAHGNLFLILFGLALSIPIIMWGSGMIAKALNAFPWLVYAGAGILGYIAGDLIGEDQILIQGDWRHTFPSLLGILVILYGQLWRFKKISESK